MERRIDRAKKHKQRPETKIAGLIPTPDFRKIVEDVYTDLRGQDPEFKKKEVKKKLKIKYGLNDEQVEKIIINGVGIFTSVAKTIAKEVKNDEEIG